jgi:hypothetical protein
MGWKTKLKLSDHVVCIYYNWQEIAKFGYASHIFGVTYSFCYALPLDRRVYDCVCMLHTVCMCACVLHTVCDCLCVSVCMLHTVCYCATVDIIL